MEHVLFRFPLPATLFVFVLVFVSFELVQDSLPVDRRLGSLAVFTTLKVLRPHSPRVFGSFALDCCYVAHYVALFSAVAYVSLACRVVSAWSWFTPRRRRPDHRPDRAALRHVTQRPRYDSLLYDSSNANTVRFPFSGLRNFFGT
jgi:hypothetical protein